MMYHYIVGVGAFVLLSLVWVGVQRAWKRSFADVGDDPDALADRPGCFGCARASSCSGQMDSDTRLNQEEMR
jgi:hypothetical protein